MDATWPPRPVVCLDCRSALPGGVPCPAGHPRAVELASVSGRERLLCEVWGSPFRRQRLRAMCRTGAGTSGGGMLFDGCSGLDWIDGDLGSILMAIVLLFALGCLLWAAATGIAALVRWWRSRLEPTGALWPPAGAGPPTGRTGTVVAHGALAPAPLTWTRSVGFGALLEHRSRLWRQPVTTLCDGASLGFDVLLDDGGRVRIPPGALLVDVTNARRVRPDRLLLAHYLAELDPQRDAASDLDPFPANRARTVAIQPGDRVEVLGPLEPRADPTAPSAGYREPASSTLIATGLPRLRRIT
jgi:hypothetical protein